MLHCFQYVNGHTALIREEPFLNPAPLLPVPGDHFYKRNKSLPPEEQMISSMPDVKVLTLHDDHDFMVIACDGIW